MKELRVRMGLGQKEVASELDMPVRRYGSYERGERTLSLIDAARIADVFECTLDELAGREWPPEGRTSDEARLVDAYRECTPREKSSLLNMAQTMADDGQAKNDQVGGVA